MSKTSIQKQMGRKVLALAKVYALLEPGPVVLLTTADQPHANIMTLSWQTMLEFEPPQIACVVSNGNHSFQQLQASGECVINIPTADLAEQVVGCGNCSGANVDKFAHFGLTAIPAAQVAEWLARARQKGVGSRETIEALYPLIPSSYIYYIAQKTQVAGEGRRIGIIPYMYREGRKVPSCRDRRESL